MDNYFKQCPALMSDGRLFTDYRMPTRREEHIKYMNGVTRNDDYRMFLQQNAETIMDREWDSMKQKKSCFVSECIHNYPTRVYPPWFVEEINNYDSLPKKNRKKFTCEPENDYRLTVTKKGNPNK